jgi:hypothetical protein
VQPPARTSGPPYKVIIAVAVLLLVALAGAAVIYSLLGEPGGEADLTATQSALETTIANQVAEQATVSAGWTATALAIAALPSETLAPTSTDSPQPSETPRPTDTPPPTETSTPTATRPVICEGAAPTRLAIGGRARVITFQVNVRSGPGAGYSLVNRLAENRMTTILEGPICSERQLWYHLASDEFVNAQGLAIRVEGWTSEESGGDYLLEPSN